MQIRPWPPFRHQNVGPTPLIHRSNQAVVKAHSGEIKSFGVFSGRDGADYFERLSLAAGVVPAGSGLPFGSG
jgi:hypothetical protein